MMGSQFVLIRDVIIAGLTEEKGEDELGENGKKK